MHQIHPFDEAIQLEPQGDGHWRGHTHEAYGNMVGPFGGATAAAALAAVLAHPATAEFIDAAMRESWVSEKNEMDID